MEAPTTPLEAGLDLMRRMPPDAVVDNLASVLDLVPELTEELLEKVDQPLQVCALCTSAPAPASLTVRASPAQGCC